MAQDESVLVSVPCDCGTSVLLSGHGGHRLLQVVVSGPAVSLVTVCLRDPPLSDVGVGKRIRPPEFPQRLCRET